MGKKGKKKDQPPAEKKEEAGPKPSTTAAPPQEQPADAPAAVVSGREKKHKQRERVGKQTVQASDQPLLQEVAGGDQPQQAMGRGKVPIGGRQIQTSPLDFSQPTGGQPLTHATGRGQTPPPGFAQSPHQSGRGQPPPDRRGRGQTPPGDHMGRGQPTGRGQTPPGDQMGRGQTAFSQIQEQRGQRQITPPGLGQPGQMPPPGVFPQHMIPFQQQVGPPQQRQKPSNRGKAASPPKAVDTQAGRGQPPPPPQQRQGRGQPTPQQQQQGHGQPPPQQQKQPGHGQPQQQQQPGRRQPPPPQQHQSGRAQPQLRPDQGAVRKDIGQRGPPPQQQDIPGDQSSVATLTKDLKGLHILERKVMKSSGTLGRKIPIETNHLLMKLDRIVPKAIHYDITITPDKPKRMMRPVWEEFRKLRFPNLHPAFDDVKNVYSPTIIPDNKLEGEVELKEDVFDKPRKYTIVMKIASEVSLTALVDYFKYKGKAGLPSDALQCIDIVLRNASALRFVRCLRSFYTPPHGQIIDLGNGMELWHGFFQSAILGWKPYLNVDVANKAFPKEINVVDLMAEMSRQNARQMDEIDRYAHETISKHLRGLKIRYEIPNIPSSRRTIRANSLINTNSKDTRFTDHGGVVDTVYNYFEKTKKYKIKYPKLPLIWVGPKDRKFYFPAELCTIMPGQVTQRKLDESQTRTMVRNAATSTVVRKRNIQDAIYKANVNEDPCVKAFGISVTDQFAQLKARVLPPPTLAYRQNKQVTPQKGQWRNEQFFEGKSLTNWKVLNLTWSIKPNQIEYFCKMFKDIGERSCNMKIEDVKKPIESINCKDLRLIRQYFVKNTNMELIIVIVPERPADVYSLVKQQAELVVGCLTQCIKDKTLFKSLNQATVANILLKVNAKLNGTNHCIADICRPFCLKRPCMIMGADVNHPSPEQRDRPSYAAVTASHDPRAFQYNICWRLQPSREEMIIDLEQITYDHLLFFYSKTKFKPEKIVFFRDGVSEGQFEKVLNIELRAIRRACVRVQADGKYNPAITFLVVQKRHHTRFFPQNQRDSEDRNNNVPAGTCVDTDIIHPSDIEYYLVSHASIQGVARPTKYRMLWDDNNMTDDEIQSLTYYLCHMFTRCNRSVSYPAPTYYAHLAAKRAFTYFEGKPINMDNLRREQENHQIKKEIVVDKPMFFV